MAITNITTRTVNSANVTNEGERNFVLHLDDENKIIKAEEIKYSLYTKGFNSRTDSNDYSSLEEAYDHLEQLIRESNSPTLEAFEYPSLKDLNQLIEIAPNNRFAFDYELDEKHASFPRSVVIEKVFLAVKLVELPALENINAIMFMTDPEFGYFPFGDDPAIEFSFGCQVNIAGKTKVTDLHGKVFDYYGSWIIPNLVPKVIAEYLENILVSN